MGGSPRFSNSVACVIGGGGGMGEATARLLASEGATVAVCDVNEERARAVAAECPGARGFGLDVRDAGSVRAVVDAIEAQLGPIDALALTSGIFEARPFFGTPDELWADLYAVNVFGAVRALRAVGEKMRERRRGSIVVVASQSAKVVRLDQCAYGSSKAALSYIAKELGLELAGFGIRVNVVQPGVTESPLTARVWGDAAETFKKGHVDGALHRYRVPIPLQKVGQPEDVATAIAYLLSNEAAHITMAELIVDGGSNLLA